MKNRLFYAHEDDRHIMLKKDCVEIQHWVETLTYYALEMDAFMAIIDESKEPSPHREELKWLKEQNKVNLKNLSRYELVQLKAWECYDVDCELFYLNNHEEFRQIVMDHISAYRTLKKELFKEILEKVKKS
ncbi:hypothetical protein MWU59_12535 [Flavobacteriaceae bacterium F08102]|nr:hypothetical protein [Flavobacteriaceae bacterium F08102]